MEYKIGDAVTVAHGAYEGITGHIAHIDGSAVPYMVVLNVGGNDWFQEEYLTPTKPSWDTLTQGMIIENRSGSKAKVLRVTGDVFLLSNWDNYDVAGAEYTKAEAQKEGLKVCRRRRHPHPHQSRDSRKVRGG